MALASARRGRARGSIVANILAFGGAVGLVLAYALRGGSYDLVPRQEYALVAWWIVGIGLAVGVLPRSRPSRSALIALGALLAYAGWTALSLLWTESSEMTMDEIARVLGYIGIVVLIGLVLDRSTWRSAAAGLVSGAFIVCALAVASRLHPAWFPADPIKKLAPWDNRLDYPLGYWNGVAAWGAMSAAIGLAWSAHDRSLVRRAIALALVPVAGVAIYLTYSRAGTFGLALALIVGFLVSRNRFTFLIHAAVAAATTALAILMVRKSPEIAHWTGTTGGSSVFAALVFGGAVCAGVAILTGVKRADNWRLPKRVRRPVTVASTLAALLVVAGAGPIVVKRGWHSFTHTANVTSTDPAARLMTLSSTRYNLWRSAFDAFKQDPAGGTGAGTFELWWNRHQRDEEFVYDAHSIWFENLGELGAPGLLLIVAVVAAVLWLGITVRRRTRRGVSTAPSAALLAGLAVYVLHASVDWMWELTAVAVLALAGVAILGARLALERRPIRWYVRVGLVLLAAGAAWTQVPGLLGTVDIRRSEAADRAGNADLAMSYTNRAVSAEPWAASAYAQRGLLLEAAGRLDKAATDLQHAIDHERTQFSLWLLLSRIETERGRYGAAVRDYNKAHQLRPKASVFYYAPYFATH